MKIKDQTRKLAQCVDKTDEVSSKHRFELWNEKTKSVTYIRQGEADVV
ncbi:chlorohydrolase [Streptococcus pneumoniae]|nr:chlorohydrolase [Streptococcus pneumoniae]